MIVSWHQFMKLFMILSEAIDQIRLMIVMVLNYESRAYVQAMKVQTRSVNVPCFCSFISISLGGAKMSLILFDSFI